MNIPPEPPRRLLFVHPSDELYGADRMLLEMVAAVPASIDVEVWLPTDLAHPPDGRSLCGELERRGVRVQHKDLPILRRAYNRPSGAVQLARRSLRTLGDLRAYRADAVYCTTSAAFLCAPLARLARVPMVIGHVQEIWSSTDSLVLRGPARACRRLVCISTAVADALPPPVRRRSVVVPNGTVEPMPESTRRAGSSTPLRFLIASRWNGWKGHRTLLDAWDRAGSPGQLVVLGGPPPSGDAADVRALVAQLSDPGSVTIVGEVADSSLEYERADVMIVPSDRPEPFGLVAIEAFARSRPVIASAAGGLLEIVTPGRDGWLFPPRDVDALAAVLTSLTPAAVQAAAEAARETYEERFTVDRFAENWRRAALSA